jgi:signal transduction histidine kinase
MTVHEGGDIPSRLYNENDKKGDGKMSEGWSEEECFQRLCRDGSIQCSAERLPTLLAVIVHDLRNRFTGVTAGIDTAAETLARDQIDPETKQFTQDVLKIAQDNVIDVSNMCNAILRYASQLHGRE